jgi:hypothetical protein
MPSEPYFRRRRFKEMLKIFSQAELLVIFRRPDVGFSDALDAARGA